jgi:hypothetical protein
MADGRGHQQDDLSINPFGSRIFARPIYELLVRHADWCVDRRAMRHLGRPLRAQRLIAASRVRG